MAFCCRTTSSNPSITVICFPQTAPGHVVSQAQFCLICFVVDFLQVLLRDSDTHFLILRNKTSVKIKVGSGFCPFSCVRRLAECDASLVVKVTSTTLRFPLESSTCVVLFLSPQNLSGFAGTPVKRSLLYRPWRLFQKAPQSNNDQSKFRRLFPVNLGRSLQVGLLPYRSPNLPQTSRNAATLVPRTGNHG